MRIQDNHVYKTTTGVIVKVTKLDKPGDSLWPFSGTINDVFITWSIMGCAHAAINSPSDTQEAYPHCHNLVEHLKQEEYPEYYL